MDPIEVFIIPDPQQQPHTKICPTCGRTVYAPGYHCPKCQEAES